MAAEWFAKYGLQGTASFADPGRALYRAFGLRRGTFGQLFGIGVLARGAALLLRYGVGRGGGDKMQMPGTVVFRDGKVTARHDCVTAADRPDYVALARSGAG